MRNKGVQGSMDEVGSLRVWRVWMLSSVYPSAPSFFLLPDPIYIILCFIPVGILDLSILRVWVPQQNTRPGSAAGRARTTMTVIKTLRVVKAM